MVSYRTLRDLDWPLLAVTLALCALGVLQIYSATVGTHWHDAWWKQIVWIGSGLVMMWITAAIDYHALLGRVLYFYVGAVTLLIATAVIVCQNCFDSSSCQILGGPENEIADMAGSG